MHCTTISGKTFLAVLNLLSCKFNYQIFYRCWQTESDWNLIIKIPHSLLLIMNICCATFIFRVLYSQTMSRSMATPELAVNIKKYRNLAKSILILIPIFGLHFIFFAWLPYAKAMNINIGPCIEICIIYIEIFFNAFQVSKLRKKENL